MNGTMQVTHTAMGYRIIQPYSHLLSQRFDRKTFSVEVENYGTGHATIVRRLRVVGHARRAWYSKRRGGGLHDDNHRFCCSSRALRAINLATRERGVFLDLGCGDSADAAIARELGFKAVGLDLFEPSPYEVHPSDVAPFILADVADAIPFRDGSVDIVVSQAMVDLIEPEARPRFYSEVYRVLKVGGLFALNPVHLVNGYGVVRADEKRLCARPGFYHVDSDGPVLIFKKFGGQ